MAGYCQNNCSSGLHAMNDIRKQGPVGSELHVVKMKELVAAVFVVKPMCLPFCLSLLKL